MQCLFCLLQLKQLTRGTGDRTLLPKLATGSRGLLLPCLDRRMLSQLKQQNKIKSHGTTLPPAPPPFFNAILSSGSHPVGLIKVSLSRSLLPSLSKRFRVAAATISKATRLSTYTVAGRKSTRLRLGSGGEELFHS